MANYLKLYQGNPTAGGTDGTEISEGGTFTAPIQATLVTDEEHGASSTIKCAARCVTGYQTDGTVELKFRKLEGTSYSDYSGDDYQISSDGETWASSLTFPNSIGATNTIFYVKLSAAAASAPANDRSVSLYHTETVKAVA